MKTKKKVYPLYSIIIYTLYIYTDTEKYKRLEAVYLGCRYVTAPHGISVVNRSVSHLSHDKSKWIPVYVDVATSHVKILDKKVSKSVYSCCALI